MDTRINRVLFVTILVAIIILYIRINKTGQTKGWIIPFEVLGSMIVGVLFKLFFSKQNG